ncbi:MAG: DMT family transporter [Deltaproteobacteria bacterium]|nr:DMT family transporter [Deltaproteobacteria bacterium]
MDFSPQLVALASTAVYAAGNLYARVGLVHSTPLIVTLISLIVQTVVVWTILLARGGVPAIDSRALMIFIAVGAVLPIVRLLSYIGIARIGSARSSSLRSTHPFFSAALAIAFLGEPAKHNVMLGTLLIVAGIFFTCWEPRENNVDAKPTDALYPLAAALMSGLIHPATRFALTGANQPIAYSAIVGMVSLLCLSAYFVLTGQVRRDVWPSRAALIPFVTASLLETVGFLLFSAAVSLGPVVLIAPIMATTPMWVLLGSIILLRDLEKVTLRTALGSSAVVGGTILLTLNK